MFRKWFVSIFVFVLFLMPVHVANVLAGTEPSPFQPEINQLGAVENILDSAKFRIDMTMGHPPDPCVPPEPCKDLNGDINRLAAIENQVASTNNMVGSMIVEVMGFEPTPFREELVPPLEAIRGVAEDIVGEIYLFMDTEPESQAAEFLEALGQVSDSAIMLIGTVDNGIEQLKGEAIPCGEITNSEDCTNTLGCFWDDAGFCIAVGY
jgi:hypothetical protein